MINFLKTVFRESRDREAMIHRGEATPYDWLLQRTVHWECRLGELGIRPGAVVALEADFSPDAVAAFLALIERRCVVVPLTSSVAHNRKKFCSIAEVDALLWLEGDAEVEVGPARSQHEHYRTLRESNHPGLVLFSSGSTGESKAAVHDMTYVLNKFRKPRRGMRTIPFLLFDHIGGVNTMLHTLSNGGTLVTVESRQPDAVLDKVARHRVELLPTSPTFLNLVLLSEAHTRHDLSSLELVTYGTEPMPESTLRRFREACPHVRMQQTYGLSEVGILR